MKKLMILCSLFLLMGLTLKVQAQQVEIRAYQDELKQLDEAGKKDLKNLVEMPVPTLLVNNRKAQFLNENRPAGGNKLLLRSPQDWNILANSNFSAALNAVKIISIHWDGTSSFSFPNDAFENMYKLKYIYIRSTREGLENTISASFSNLIQQLDELENVIVLYQQIEQPQ